MRFFPWVCRSNTMSRLGSNFLNVYCTRDTTSADWWPVLLKRRMKWMATTQFHLILSFELMHQFWKMYYLHHAEIVAKTGQGNISPGSTVWLVCVLIIQSNLETFFRKHMIKDSVFTICFKNLFKGSKESHFSAIMARHIPSSRYRFISTT